MAYYPDLGACTYFSMIDAPLVAVGWLAHGQPVPRGQVSKPVFDRLFELLRDPWEPAHCMGWHTCDFCHRGEQSFSSRPYARTKLQLGITNLFVPGDGRLYVAPSMILHYIDTHDYAPPVEFQQAVLDCAPMGSPQYLQAVAEFGVREV